MTAEELIVPIAGSLLAGALIGLERETHSRPAGMRTHTLVCLASALVMLGAVHQSEWNLSLVPGGTVVADPTRMAHGVLTGVGFLCAGVIFRQGFGVRGLATATSLWMTATLGLLFGVGLTALAAVGTIVTLAVLTLFRVMYRWLPRRIECELVVRTTPPWPAEGFAAILSANRLRLLHAERRQDLDGTVEQRARVSALAPIDLDKLHARLASLPGICGFEILPHDFRG